MLRRFTRWPALVVIVVLVLLCTGAVVYGPALRRPSVTLSGLARPVLNAQTLATTVVSVDPDGRPGRLLVDGHAVATSRGPRIVERLAGLTEGPHVLTAEVDRGFPLGVSRVTRNLLVDTTPPVLKVDPAAPADIRAAVTITGHVTGAQTLLGPDGRPVIVGPDGSFAIHFPTPPAGAVLVARDAAGNTANAVLDVPVRHPSMRGVHMTALAWTAAVLRDPILQMVREHKIDTIELDIKDEDGLVGFASKNPLARQIGAVKGYYDAAKVVAELHAMHVRVVGRLVAFRDPTLAPWAYAHGHRDWVIQAPDGAPYKSAYGGFTNFANPAVRQYNIDIAAEAAQLGFDDILYDYCRRPDGAISTMRFPGLSGPPDVAIANFMRDTRAALRPLGAYVGASVFGIAADRPQEVAQNVPMMGQYLDFVSPMVYPSHWAKGEYGVADPNREPGAIVGRSLQLFVKDLRGTTAQVAPWLQDFSLGVPYGPGEVRAQIDAARRDGIDSFLLWNAGARYQSLALDSLPSTKR